MKILSVFVWLFFTVTSVIGALLGAYGLLSLGDTRGPGGMFSGIVVIIALGVIGVCIVVFLVCLKFVPPRDSLTAGNLLISSGLYGVILASLWATPHVANDYTLTVQVLDSAKRPIQGAQIKYYGFHRRSGLYALMSSPANGTASTDAAGQVTIHTNNQDRTEGLLTVGGYRHAQFEIEDEYYKKHVVSISWQARGLHPDWNQPHFSESLPADKQVLLTVYLPHENEGDVLPYVRSP
jgi:hypothetical protein